MSGDSYENDWDASVLPITTDGPLPPTAEVESVPPSKAWDLSPLNVNKADEEAAVKLATVPAELPESITIPVPPLLADIDNPCVATLSLIEPVKLFALISTEEPDSTNISDELLSNTDVEPLTKIKSTLPIVISWFV